MHSEDSLEPATQARPTNVPEKFWDPAKGEIRVEALLRAYRDLERHASAAPRGAAAALPGGPDGYKISHRHPKLASSMEVNKRLHAAGFSQEQAQLVYDLAHDCLLPLLDQAGGQDDHAAHLAELARHFGGESRWRQLAPQLAAWGKKNLPPEAYQALVASPDGVKALHRLMASGEPSLGRAAPASEETPSEEELKKMIRDPRYWKTRDPAFIAKVSAGFGRLYGEG
ncbi:hypothetical protein A6A04_01790 [Paramagnetospirillum marisnigri]|uniref:Uncharacterized protein n=1 Tax=Paramagnetospirillum marisnigri TaxID=1285242 RepID=A0A178MPY6_9PROT|nr:hypothetical protein [Paramagnetospirillum marisnigri]OAN50168.1 hypothetical protein A6A04_01790 [Paramagnetospirillum marisnigri]